MVLKNDTLKAHFINPDNAEYYTSEIFEKILNYIKSHSSNCTLKEVRDRPVLIIRDLPNVMQVKNTLKKMNEIS